MGQIITNYYKFLSFLPANDDVIFHTRPYDMQNRSRMPTNQKAFELSRTGSQTDLFAVIRNSGIDGSADNKAGPIICRGTAFGGCDYYYFFLLLFIL